MLEQIEQIATHLTPTEQRVAQWVLANPRQAISATLASVARSSGASEPTVIRFCRRLGVGGFREFTTRLTERLSQPTSVIHSSVKAEDSIEDASYKVVDASIQSLIDLRGRLSALPIAKVARQLACSRQIVFMGLGASGSVARDACHKFFRLGIPCALFSDTPSILQFASIANAETALVLVSHTGEWPELSQAACKARALGATTIAVTQSGSALATSVDSLLACESNEDASIYTPMSSRLAHLALLDALQVAVALELGDVARQKLQCVKLAVQRA